MASKVLKIFVLAAFLVAAIQIPVDAATIKINFFNKSTKTVVKFYSRPSDRSDWNESDYCRNFGTLAPGRSFIWTITCPNRYTDIAVLLSDNTWRQEFNIDTFNNEINLTIH